MIIAFDAGNRPIHSLNVLYDVNGHQLSLDTFIRTSAEYERLFQAINDELFDGNLQFKVYVFAPEPGSFRQMLGIAIVAGFGALTGPLMGEFGSGLVEGLSGKPASEWGEELGQEIRDGLQRAKPMETSEEEATEAEVKEDEVGNAVAVEILIRSSEGFMEQPTRSLNDFGIGPEDFPDMFSAKNSFYEAVEENPHVSAISFGDEPEKQIPREQFAQRVTPIRPRETIEWKFEVRRLSVTSPNWDKNDRQRGWKGRDRKGRVIFFTVIDPNFWARFERKSINSDTIDEMIVQMATKIENGKVSGRYIVNVLSYNDDHFANELADDRLLERLQDIGLEPIEPDTDDFFDDLNT